MRTLLIRACGILSSIGVAALACHAVAAENLPPVDGLVISIRSTEGKKPEALVSHTLKDGKTTTNAVVYQAEDRIISACLSPFGNQVALILPGGTVAIVSVDGKNLRELADDALWVQWPASDGGRWVYYMDAKSKCTLRRVNIKTQVNEAVVTFDHAIEQAAMSSDASPSAGWMLVPGGDSGSYASLYPMARGSGNTFATPEWWQLSMTPNQRLTISPDGTAFGIVAPDGTFLVIGVPAFDDLRAGYRLDAVNYRNRPASWYKDVDWMFSNAAGAHQLKAMYRVEERLGLKQALFVQPVWSVNHPGWVLLCRQNYAEAPTDSAKKPVSSDLVLWDVAAGAHHGIPSHDNVTESAAGVFERPVGFWENLPAEYSLGYYRGKAPFTVQIDDDRIQEEMTWDFGDGSPRVKGRTVKHTYTKEGRCQIVAEKGVWAKPLRDHLKDPTDGLYFADVTIAKATPPEAKAYWVDSTHLLVEFSEPVQTTKEAQVSLGKGKVEKWLLIDSGRRLAIQLAEPLTRDDHVQFDGFVDQAESPNALLERSVKVTLPAWPSDRSRLVFLWEDAFQCNAIYDRTNAQIRRMELMHDGPDAGIDALGRMQLGEGGTRANLRLENGIGKGDLAEVVLDSTFSFECTFQPSNLTQQALRKPPRMVSLGSHRTFVSLFEIAQQANRLLVSIKTDDNWIEDMGQPLSGWHDDPKYHPKPEDRRGFGPYFYGHGPWIEVATLKDTRAHHLVVTYKPGVMITYLDGEKVYSTDRVTGPLNWGWGMLVFGAHHGLSGGGDFWQGNLEGAAMYSRFLEPAEVKRNFEIYAKKIGTRP